MKKWLQRAAALLIILILVFVGLLPFVKNQKWYNVSPTIMHAGGGIDGNHYTNSREAIEYNLSKGKKIFEVDFNHTSDGVLVCRHDWRDLEDAKPLSLEEFMSTPTEGGYTPMTAPEAIELLASQKDVYLVVDIKAKRDGLAPVYEELVQICRDTGNEKFLDRVIVQIYYEEQYAAVKAIYPFKNWIFTLYRMRPEALEEYEAIAYFCKANKIDVVTVRHNWVNEDTMAIFHKYGLECFAYTVNEEEIYRSLIDYGVKGIYTDFL